ncbi:MAG: hypothetical protein ACE5RT_06570, partial [Nitrosopumilaceae archaeon]
MNSRAIWGISLAAVFAVTMMFSPILATDALTIVKPDFDEFTMKVHGTPGSVGSAGHDVLVYAFFTDKPGKTASSFIAHVAAVHPSFDDDNEQKNNVGAVHAHALELNNESLCVQALAKQTTAKVSGDTV